MGYTHYWHRKGPEISPEVFNAIVKDFKKMRLMFNEFCLKLAGWDGTGNPLLSPSKVSFNGDVNCGHTERDLGITWPKKGANGVNTTHGYGDVGGEWIGGAQLNTRTCGGDCSHESFTFKRIDRNDFEFNFCKTAYKPYDIAVNAFLIIAKHHMGNDLNVSSDGDIEEWADAMNLCNNFLGYGNDFYFGYTREEEEAKCSNA